MSMKQMGESEKKDCIKEENRDIPIGQTAQFGAKELCKANELARRDCKSHRQTPTIWIWLKEITKAGLQIPPTIKTQRPPM